jgi:hypothetical protein
MLWRMTSSLLSAAALAFAALLVLASPAAGGQNAQPGRQRVDVAKLGPQVGARVPDFSLPDQTGRVRDLQSIMGPRGAMLVFYRSADW